MSIMKAVKPTSDLIGYIAKRLFPTKAEPPIGKYSSAYRSLCLILRAESGVNPCSHRIMHVARSFYRKGQGMWAI